MSFFGRRKKNPSQGTVLQPRRNRAFRKQETLNSGDFRPKIFSWIVGYVFLWVVFFGFLVYVFFFSSLLQIHRHVFLSIRAVSSEEVSVILETFLSGKSFGIFPNNTLPVAFLRREKLKDNLLQNFPIFRSVKVAFSFPDRVTLSAEERKKTIVLCSGGPCFSIDERGFPYESAVSPFETFNQTADVFIVDISAKPILFSDAVFSEEFLRNLFMFRSALSEELDISTLNRIETPSCLSDDVRFKTSEGWMLFASLTIPVENTLRSLRLLFLKTVSEVDRKNMDYIDLRTENKIFYLLRGEKEKEEKQPVENEKRDKKKEKKE